MMMAGTRHQREAIRIHMSERDELKHYFSQCIEENMGPLYAMAQRLTANSADAEDLVADSVVKAWSAIAGLEDRGRFRSWIFHILYNCFISNYRRKSVRPAEMHYDENASGDEGQEITALLIKQPDDFLLWWANPERIFANGLLGEKIMAAIHSLPEAFRVTVLLINLEGFSYDEAAEILGVPPGTVRSRMKRGRTLLQKALWEHAVEAGLVQGDELKEDRA
jgi:RNA polymerase sigma-70 factor (ECF subfamily)